MANTTQKSVILIAVFILNCSAIILMAVSLATKYWLTEYTTINTSSSTSPATPGIPTAGSTWTHPPSTIGPTGASWASTGSSGTTWMNPSSTAASTITGASSASTGSSGTTWMNPSSFAASTITGATQSTITAEWTTKSTIATGSTLVTTEPATSTVVTTEPATSTVESTVITPAPGPGPLRRPKVAHLGSSAGLQAVKVNPVPVASPIYYVDIYMGLFNGHVSKAYFVPRECDFSVPGHIVMSMGLWVVTVIFYLLAIILGVVSAVFAAINATMTPIEEITGMTGLYVWNGLAALFSLAGILCYVGLHAGDLGDIGFKDNLVCTDDSTPVVLDSGSSSFGYSFYITIGVLALFVVNLGLIFLTTRSLGSNKNPPPEDFGDDDKNQGVIMLF